MFFRGLAVVAAAAALAFAQGGPRGGGRAADPAARMEMRVNFLANWLTLTDAQKSATAKIYTDAQTASESLRTRMETARTALKDAVKKNATATIDQTALEIGSLMGQTTAIEGKADAAFYALLTAEQKAKYDAGPARREGGMGPQGYRSHD
jgi:Spy/CpxP family protein refolding chaperone